MNNYRGITYFKFLDNRFFHWLFKKYFCKKNIHLFDECESIEWHFLSCDACGLEVHIKKIIEEKDSDIEDMEIRNDIEAPEA